MERQITASTLMTAQALLSKSEPFVQYILDWEASLPSQPLAAVVEDAARTVVISVDMINGFCHVGPLSSPRIKDIINPIVTLFNDAYALGIRQFVLTQDTHDPDAVEFGSYPPHCVRGTEESDSVPEFKALPFYDEMAVFEKNSTNSFINTGLEDFLSARPELDTFIVVGDCTDLCTYQLAMHLRLRANAQNLQQRVILPVDCVDTYDLPVDTAKEIGAVPHDGDLLHHIFLYSMMLNGVDVVASLAGQPESALA